MHNHYDVGNSFTYILFTKDPVTGLPTKEDLINLLETDEFYMESFQELWDKDLHSTTVAIADLYCGFIQPARHAPSSINCSREIEIVVLAPYWVPYSSFLRLKFSQGLVCGIRLTRNEADEIFDVRERIDCANYVHTSFVATIRELMNDASSLREVGLYDPVVSGVDWNDLFALKDTYGLEACIKAQAGVFKFMDGKVWEDNPTPFRPLPLSQFFDVEQQGPEDASI